MNAKLVESKSGSRPHFVTVKAKHKYSCDSDCAMFKCAKICSHTIACAYLDDQLQSFLNQATSVPNLYELAKSDMKQKAGKKPSKRKASSKSTIKAITEQKSNSPSCIVSTPPVIPTSIESVLSMNLSNSTSSNSTNTGSQVASSQSSSANFTSADTVSSPSVSLQGNVYATLTSCNSVQLSSFVQSPVASVTHVAPPLMTSTANTPYSCPQNININQAANALINVISQVLSGSSSATAVNPLAVTIDLNYLFWIVFVSGNISRCQGCANKIMRNADGKPLPPPNDLVVQHKEQVMFTNPNTGKYLMSREHRNVYYHARVNCIRQKFPSFTPIQHCRINRDTFTNFTEVHKDFIAKEFGLKAVM